MIGSGMLGGYTYFMQIVGIIIIIIIITIIITMIKPTQTDKTIYPLVI